MTNETIKYITDLGFEYDAENKWYDKEFKLPFRGGKIFSEIMRIEITSNITKEQIAKCFELGIYHDYSKLVNNGCD